jgi:hypothetical protein
MGHQGNIIFLLYAMITKITWTPEENVFSIVMVATIFSFAYPAELIVAFFTCHMIATFRFLDGGRTFGTIINCKSKNHSLKPYFLIASKYSLSCASSQSYFG